MLVEARNHPAVLEGQPCQGALCECSVRILLPAAVRRDLSLSRVLHAYTSAQARQLVETSVDIELHDPAFPLDLLINSDDLAASNLSASNLKVDTGHLASSIHHSTQEIIVAMIGVPNAEVGEEYEESRAKSQECQRLLRP